MTDNQAGIDIKREVAANPVWVYSLVAPTLMFKRAGATEMVSRCPFPGHEDRHGSFYVATAGDGAGLWICRSGCGGGNIFEFAVRLWGVDNAEAERRLAEGLGMARSGGKVERRASRPQASKPRDEGLGPVIARHAWDARDEETGAVIGTHHRTDHEPKPGAAKPGKRVWWEWAGSKRPLEDMPLYNPLPFDAWASTADLPVVIVEGEKSADSLQTRGVPALGTMGGAAATPSDTVLARLAHRTVWLWPDNDDAGRSHMEAIAKGLQRAGGDPMLVRWATQIAGGDAADHPGDTSELLLLLSQATHCERVWSPLSIAVGHDVVRKTVGETEWLWYNHIPLGYVTAIGGDTGIGKSLWLQYVCMAAGGTMPWPDGTPCPDEMRQVIWVDGEGRQGIVSQRVDDIGLHPGVLLYPGEKGLGTLSIDTEEGLEGLRDMIARFRPVMVAMDPFGGVHKQDRNKADVGNLLLELTLIARDTRTAIVVVHDRTKVDKKFGSPLMGIDDAMGSKQLVQKPVMVWGIDKPDPETIAVRVNCLKNNMGELAPPMGYVTLPDKKGLQWVDPPQPHREETPTDRAVFWLERLLRQGPMPEGAILQQARSNSHEPRPLSNAKANLRIVQVTNGQGQRCWALPANMMQMVSEQQTGRDGWS